MGVSSFNCMENISYVLHVNSVKSLPRCPRETFLGFKLERWITLSEQSCNTFWIKNHLKIFIWDFKEKLKGLNKTWPCLKFQNSPILKSVGSKLQHSLKTINSHSFFIENLCALSYPRSSQKKGTLWTSWSNPSSSGKSGWTLTYPLNSFPCVPHNLFHFFLLWLWWCLFYWKDHFLFLNWTSWTLNYSLSLFY